MDERTKELGSQLDSAAEEDVDDKKTTDEGKTEDTEDTEKETDEKKQEDKDEPEKEEIEDKDNEEKKEGEKTKTEEDGKTENKDRWHGKSREEVIKSFEDLEKQMGESKTDKPDKNTEPEKPKTSDDKKDELEIPADEELAKMTPKGFAEWMIRTVGKMVEKTYETRGKVKDAVAAEIREVQKEHPLLKTNQEYRGLILALIDAAAQKGTVMPLKEACGKVDALIGTVKGESQITDEDKARLKKAKAQVERGAGAPASPGEDKGAEQKRLENIFGTGRSKSPFGGLGV